MNYRHLLVLLSFILGMSFLLRLGGSEFYFIHDEFMLMNQEKAIHALNTRNFESLGIANTTQMIVNFLDVIFYNVAYGIGMNLIQAQGVLMIAKLLLLTLLPFAGFSRIYRKIFEIGELDLGGFLISLFYSFNSYTLVYWHGNNFSLSLLVCYALAPLAFASLHENLLTKTPLESKLKTVLVLYAMSFGFYLFAVFALFMFVYLAMYLVKFRSYWRIFFKNFVSLSMLFAPLISILIFIPYEMLFSGATTINANGGETYGSLAGGLLYPLFLWFSWGIYTYWEPRNIYTFHEYFKSIFYLLPTVGIYPFILFFVPKGSVRRYFIIFLVVLLTFLFFVKGTQPPLGELFSYLVANFIPFRIFRSPDNKFGFGIIFSICLLLLLSYRAYPKKLFAMFMLILCLSHGFIFFSGLAIAGENTATSSDRIIHYSPEHMELLNFLGNKRSEFGYILPSPLIDFGLFTIDGDEKHLGQDLISKTSVYPFIYLNVYSSMSRDSFNKLSQVLDSQDPFLLQKYPLRYILLRNDVASLEPDAKLRRFAESNASSVFKNKLYELYELPWNTDLVTSDYGKVTYKIKNASKIELDLSNLTKEEIDLQQSYSYNWQLYEKNSASSLPILADLNYLFAKPVANTIKSANGYGNSWDLSAVTNPSVGQNSHEFVLYFMPQLYFYVAVLVTSIYLSIAITYIIFRLHYAKNAKN